MKEPAYGNWTLSTLLDRCVEMAREGVVREFPCQLPISFVESLQFTRPRELTPVFYGCYDWHSAVHSHWALARACRYLPDREWVGEVVQLLDAQFQPEALAAEVRFLEAPHRRGFERPYGLAWLLQLVSELRQWELPLTKKWLQGLAPLEAIAVARFQEWLPNLPGPIRTGEHSQTAFALGLVMDWARDTGAAAELQLCRATALRFHLDDADLPLAWEPGAHDFLSPALATADLMRRCLPPDEFAAWLRRAFPADHLLLQEFQPVTANNLADGKLAHFAGLNFSRAWMANGIAHGLPVEDPSRSLWQELGQQHLVAAAPVLWCREYAVTHWVGSFAVYALTQRFPTASASATA